MLKIDAIDIRILNLLQKDASLGIKEIASKIGLSQSPTYERISRLKREGVIAKQVILVNREKLGRQLLVMCTVTLKEQSLEVLKGFEESVITLKEVLEVMCLAGNNDYLLKIALNDVDHYHQFIMMMLSKVPNILNINSSFVLKEVKRETAIELE